MGFWSLTAAIRLSSITCSFLTASCSCRVNLLSVASRNTAVP